eukprot:12542125-Heterocapsa_arctica.AAC.1
MDDKKRKSTSKKDYTKTTSCNNYHISSTKLCSGKDKCYMGFDALYNKYITDRHIIKGKKAYAKTTSCQNYHISSTK